MLKERKKHINIFHQTLPTRKQSDLFNSKNPYKKDFVIMFNRRKVGRIYLSYNNEIGIFMKRMFTNKGYGKKVIALFINKTQESIYYANISPLNIISQKFFETLGFKLIQYTYKQEVV